MRLGGGGGGGGERRVYSSIHIAYLAPKVASFPGFPLLCTKKRAKTEGSLVKFKSRASTSVTWMTSNITTFDRGRAKIKALLPRKSFNGGRNSAKTLAMLAAAARSLVRETTLKRVTFDVVHVTEVNARDLNNILPGFPPS